MNSNDHKLESSIKGVRITILFFYSIPFWVLSPFFIELLYGGEIVIDNMLVYILAYSCIFISSCLTINQLYGMSKEMRLGNFYTSRSIQKLYRGSQYLQLTGVLLVLSNFITPILNPEKVIVFFSLNFCVGYFLMILSVIFWYVTKSLKTGAALQDENKLTI